MTETKAAENTALFLERGLWCLNAKQPSAAISAFQKVLQLDATSAGAYSGIGQAFLDMEEFQGAKVAFSKSIELNPTPSRYVLLGYTLSQLGDDRLAFRAYRTALRMSPENDEALFNMGNVLKARHPKLAAALFRRAVKANPDFVESYLELGALLNRGGQFRDAKEFLEKAIDLKPDNVWIWVELANSLWRMNEESRAEEVLRTAARKFPSTAAPLWTLATYLEGVGRLQDAEVLFNQAVARQPTDQVAQSLLANFLDRHYHN